MGSGVSRAVVRSTRRSTNQSAAQRPALSFLWAAPPLAVQKRAKVHLQSMSWRLSERQAAARQRGVRGEHARGSHAARSCDLRIRIRYANRRRFPPHPRIQLLDSRGSPPLGASFEGSVISNSLIIINFIGASANWGPGARHLEMKANQRIDYDRRPLHLKAISW